MRKLAALAVIVGLIFWLSCSRTSSHKGSVDDDIDYSIERELNVDYRGWAKLEMTEGERPKARLTFHGSLDPYFSDGLEVQGEGVVVEFDERDMTMFDIELAGTKLDGSGCEDRLNYRLVLIEGGTLDVPRGALVVFCGDPEVGREVYIYRVSSREGSR
ncbi:MAG TPA: hypothetical protein ENF73_03680 [Proteobacteria bacterium]|nr:hypothetical protein [Pseudomonadota bacterium]